jgi:amidase
VWSDDPFCPVAREVRSVIEAVAGAAAEGGARVDDRARPELEPAHTHDVYSRLLRAALAARSPDELFEKNRAKAATLSPDDESPYARQMRASVQYHREWHGQSEARMRLRWAWRRFFDEWDVLVCPIACVPAFPHDHSRELESRTLEIDGETRPYWDQLFWAGLTGVAYLPATVAPGGRSAGGLPIGVQIVGPEGGDRATVEFARLLAETRIGGFRPPPDYAEAL